MTEGASMRRWVIALVAMLVAVPARAEGGFSANGNGTVTDASGLIWLEDAGCLGTMNWADAEVGVSQLSAASGMCGLADGSEPGQWRQPTRDEWNQLFAAAARNGCTAPALTDTAGGGCAAAGAPPFRNVAGRYWSSTPVEEREDKAWVAFTTEGGWDWSPKETALNVWAVRRAE